MILPVPWCWQDHKLPAACSWSKLEIINVYPGVYPDSLSIRKAAQKLFKSFVIDSDTSMIRNGFLTEQERQALYAIARNNLSEIGISRRAHAIILLDRGWSCERVAGALLLDDDTVRFWYKLYEERGQEGLVFFDFKGGLSRLTEEQDGRLNDWIEWTLPFSTQQIGAFIAKELGICYESRSGASARL